MRRPSAGERSLPRAWPPLCSGRVVAQHSAQPCGGGHLHPHCQLGCCMPPAGMCWCNFVLFSCRCGRTKTPPNCDGSHALPVEPAAQVSREALGLGHRCMHRWTALAGYVPSSSPIYRNPFPVPCACRSRPSAGEGSALGLVTAVERGAPCPHGATSGICGCTCAAKFAGASHNKQVAVIRHMLAGVGAPRTRHTATALTRSLLSLLPR